MGRRRDAIGADRDTACLRNFLGDLAARQDAAMAGLGALAELDLDHFDLRILRGLCKLIGIEGAVIGPAAEIAAADFPHEVTAVRTVIARDAPFAGIVVEIARGGPLVERHDRIGRQRSEAHRGDIEERGRIGLRTLLAADIDPPFRRGLRIGHDRMGKPFILVRIDVQFGPEGMRIELAFRPCVDEGALLVVERASLEIAFDDIGPRIGAQVFHDPADMREQWVIAPQRVLALEEIVQRQQQQRNGDYQAPAQGFDQQEDRAE